MYRYTIYAKNPHIPKRYMAIFLIEVTYFHPFWMASYMAIPIGNERATGPAPAARPAIIKAAHLFSLRYVYIQNTIRKRSKDVGYPVKE
jgi:hypothetical protein